MKAATLHPESIGCISFFRLIDNRKGTLLHAGLDKAAVRLIGAGLGYHVMEKEVESDLQKQVRRLSEGRK